VLQLKGPGPHVGNACICATTHVNVGGVHARLCAYMRTSFKHCFEEIHAHPRGNCSILKVRLTPMGTSKEEEVLTRNRFAPVACPSVLMASRCNLAPDQCLALFLSLVVLVSVPLGLSPVCGLACFKTRDQRICLRSRSSLDPSRLSR